MIQLAQDRVKHGTLRFPRKEKNCWSSRNFFHTHYKIVSFVYYNYSSSKHTLHFRDIVFFFSIPTKTNKNCILKLYLQTKHQKLIQYQYRVRPANNSTNKQHLGVLAQSQNALIRIAMSVCQVSSRPPTGRISVTSDIREY